MIRLWIEWDFGQDRMIFRNEADAFRWMQENVSLEEFDDEFETHQEIFEAGFASYDTLTFWEPHDGSLELSCSGS